MPQKLLSAFLTVSMCTCFWTSKVTLASPPTNVEQTIEDSKVKYKQLDDQILELNSKIDSLSKEIYSLKEKLQNNDTEKKNTEDEIKTINLQLTQTKDDKEKTQNILDGRIRSMYKSNMMSDMLVYALSSENIFDLVNRIQYVGKIVSLDKDLVEEINEKTESLKKNSETLNKKQNDLKTIEASLNNNIDNLNTKQKEQQESLDKLNTQKASVFSIIEENEKQLISHPLSVINNNLSSVTELQNAITTLKNLIPQLNSSNVIASANSAINSANSKIDALTAEEQKPVTPPSPPSVDDGQYIATYTMEATAYAGHGTTAMGLKPVRDPNGISTIAVDPKVIPLGSKCYIPGYGYAIASDTGGAIKGNKIDLYMNSEEECFSWGRRKVTLHLVAYPGEW